jgi:hypothetical protein
MRILSCVAFLLRIILISKILNAMRSQAPPPSESNDPIEEYELPCSEAMLAGTLALMTGYSQSLQAEHDPAQRLHISLRVAHNLERLAGQPTLSEPFRALSAKLTTLWRQMARCTADARTDCLEGALPAAPGQRLLH